MIVGVLSRMRVVVIPAKAGIQEISHSFNTKEEEKNLDPQSSWG